MSPERKSPVLLLTESVLAMAVRMIPDALGVCVVVLRQNDIEASAAGVSSQGIEIAKHLRKYADHLEREARRRKPLILLGDS